MKNKKKADKPRNAGTMTESAYWSMIRSCLRSKSRWWKPIQECKKDAKHLYKGTNKRQRFEYECSVCHEMFAEKFISVHHRKEVGTLTRPEDLAGFVERLFCEKEGLMVVCEGCHNAIHQKNKETTSKK